MAYNKSKYFQLSLIIQLFVVICNFKCVDNKAAVSNGFDAAFTHRRLHVNAATSLDANEPILRRLQRDVAEDENTDDSACKIDNVKAQLDRNSHTCHFNDSNYSLMLVWTGNDGKELLALSTLEFAFFASQSKLWVSWDFGESFQNINHHIEGAIIKKNGGLFKSPLDPRKIILVSYTEDMDKSNSRLFITTNAGKDFRKINTPFYLEGALVFHHSKSDWILASAPYQDFKLYLSTNFGHSWEAIHSGVVDFSWGTQPMGADRMIFLATNQGKGHEENGEFTLMRSRDMGTSFETIKEKIFNFGLQGKFMYVAVADKTDKPENRILEVSINHGNSWNSTHLPTITKDRFFSILDMSEGMVFMHVDDPGNNGGGTIYTSDADGIIFSTSLENHLFPNGGQITDFYRVESMRGVYLASQIGDDGTIHTMVTFDRGGVWQPIRAPDGMKCKNPDLACNLQIHNQYSQYKGVNAPSRPLSIKNATGLILAHAHISDSLEITDPDVFVSSDGGYTWRLALKGPHRYAITNHGALLLAVPGGADATNEVLFSYDEGHCWNSYKFSEVGVIVTGILPEPSARSLNVSIWGFGEDDHKWVVFTIDFGAVITRQCNRNTDYVSWVPHLDNDQAGCLLGIKETFEKVKPDSFCRIDYNYEHVPSHTTTCECHKEDYECDFGYYRENSEDDCMVSPDFADKELEVCINGKWEEIITKGYRKIPGDVCNGGNFNPTRDVEVLKKKCHDGLNLSAAQGHHSSKAAGVVITLVVILILGGVLFLIYKDKKLPCLKRNNATYSYSALSGSDDLDKMLDLESKDDTYHDSSDEDMIE